MSRRRWTGSRSVGLRYRLVLAFVLLGVTTAAAVAGGSYVVARDIILQKAQDTAVVALTDRITTRLATVRRLPPTQDDLDLIAADLSSREDSSLAVYHDQASSGDGLTIDRIPADLRRTVRAGRVAWKRVSFGKAPALVIGTELRFPETRAPSGIELYAVHSLLPEQQSIDRLATRAWQTGGLSLVLAVLLAWLAASGVLRPVRELGQAAHRLGEGDLRARLRVHGSDELADVARTFNNTADALERHVGELRRMEADARRFVADVSHELRTPLAAMTAVADVLEEEAPRLTGDAGKAARLVHQETHNLTRLVNDLIEITRFDSGTAALALDEIDVAEAVRATLRMRGWFDRVEVDLPSGVSARLDPRRLDVIVANLVGNALRHGAPPVRVRLWAEPDWIGIEVSDHGAGLEPGVLPHVFDRFYKADTARSRSDGSGLGLAIAWENARLHRDAERQGSLVAGNRPDGGAVFTLRLPRGAGAEDVTGADSGGDR